MVAELTSRAPALRARISAASARVGPLELVAALGAVLAALAGTIGADARWLSALGNIIVRGGSIPDGIPWASASSHRWYNVPVLAELIFHGLTGAAGSRGLLAAQIVAVGAAFMILAWDLRRGGAGELEGSFALLLATIGSFPVLLVVRSQLFSVLLFPVLIALLRSEARAPTRRIWLLVPLVALWSNLHGAVLVGLAVAGAYLIFDRARTEPLVAGAVLATSIAAGCVTPALVHTPDYYYGLLQNEAARRGEGLWAPLSVTSGFDILLIATAVVLVALALWARPSLWELIVMAGLAVLTVKTARSGAWLLFFAAAPAARSLRFDPSRDDRRGSVFVLAVAVALVVVGAVRGPLPSGAGKSLLADALRRAHGTPILADGIPAEQVAAAGGRVWLSNPIDAFSSHDQRLYLDWLAGRPSGDPALRHAQVVLVTRGDPAAKRLRHSSEFRQAARDAKAAVFVRRR
jgi:hypothetical protein